MSGDERVSSQGPAPADGNPRADARDWENAQLLRMLIQGVTDYAIFMLDTNGRVSTWNPGAERIKGYAPAEIIGQHFSRFYCPEDVAAGEPARALALAAREGKYEKEGWRVRKNGERFWAHIVLDAVHDENGRLVGYAKVTRDITERRQAQIELQAAREALFQAQKMEAVGQLTAGIAHDFNNMLAGVIGALDLVKLRLRDNRLDDVARYADMAISSAERAAALTARLLAFGRRQPLDIRPVDVNAAVRSMQDLLGRTMGEAIEVMLALDPALVAARTDAHQLENAILNLAINARDAMAQGGRLTIATQMVDAVPAPRTDRTDGPMVLLRVTDTGSGMAPDVVRKAFEPFFTTKPPGQGTGLGLSMVYGFAKQSGGHLALESEPGQGTVVSLYLQPAEDAPGEDHDAEAPMAASAGVPARLVLVVEDDENVRLLVQEALLELGLKTLTAEDAAGGLALLAQNPGIDLLVTDIGLKGGMNGRHLAEAARAGRADLPVLFMTGYAADAGQGGFAAAGMDLVKKPFTLQDLRERIQRLLA